MKIAEQYLFMTFLNIDKLSLLQYINRFSRIYLIFLNNKNIHNHVFTLNDQWLPRASFQENQNIFDNRQKGEPQPHAQQSTEIADQCHCCHFRYVLDEDVRHFFVF